MVENDDNGILSAEQVAALREKYPTPKTAAEKREAARLRKQAQRNREKQKKAASSTDNETDWWSQNRALLQPQELEAMLAQDEVVRDQMLVMEYATQNDIGLDDLNYIFEKDCVSDLVAFVKENPCPHLGAIHKDDSIPSDWSTGVWRNNAKYWQDPALLERLYAGEQLQNGSSNTDSYPAFRTGAWSAFS